MNRRDIRSQQRARRRNRALTGISLSLIAGLALATGAGTAAVAMTSVNSTYIITDLETELFSTVLPELHETHALANDALSAAEDELSAAEKVLAESEGKTLGAEERDALTAAVEDAQALVEKAAEALAESKSAHLAFFAVDTYADLDLAAAVEVLSESPAMTTIDLSLDSAVEAVNEAVVAWEAEQARIAAEKAAAEEAARAAAAAASQNRGGGSGSSSLPSRPGESREQRVARIAASLPFSLPGAIQFWDCASVHSQALACYKDGTIYITPRGLDRPDCRVRESIAHEYRHWWQHVNGKFQLTPDGSAYLNAEALEADARAFAAPYGC